MSREFYQEGWSRNQDSKDSVYKYDTPCQQNSVQTSNTGIPWNTDLQVEKNDYTMLTPRQEVGQTKCCPFDAYGLNTYIKSHTPINVVKDCIEDLYIPLTISVKVPVGFMIPEGRQLGSYLAIDKSALSINNMTQHYVYTNTSQYSCATPEVVKMQVSVLNGPLYYNLTLDNFVPAQGLQSNPSCETYLNSCGSLTVDKILGYAPFGYTAQYYYAIEVISQKESITLPDGKCVCKKAALEEYKCLLANPDIERVLEFSYVVSIRAVNMA